MFERHIDSDGSIQQITRKANLYSLIHVDEVRQQRTPVPMAMNVPKVPPPCNIVFPTV